jgi:hypothetical protein
MFTNSKAKINVVMDVAKAFTIYLDNIIVEDDLFHLFNRYLNCHFLFIVDDTNMGRNGTKSKGT